MAVDGVFTFLCPVDGYTDTWAWPTEITEITTLMDYRENILNQNWTDETIPELQTENVDHGLEDVI